MQSSIRVVKRLTNRSRATKVCRHAFCKRRKSHANILWLLTRGVIGQQLKIRHTGSKFTNMSTINFTELLELPINERLRLVSTLWDSISEDPNSLKLTDSERKLLDERMEAYMKKNSEGKPWSEIKSELLSR